MNNIAGLVAIVAWLCGMVLAQGWWKLVALCFAPYAWYLVAELLMQRLGAHHERPE